MFSSNIVLITNCHQQLHIKRIVAYHGNQERRRHKRQTLVIYYNQHEVHVPIRSFISGAREQYHFQRKLINSSASPTGSIQIRYFCPEYIRLLEFSTFQPVLHSNKYRPRHMMSKGPQGVVLYNKRYHIKQEQSQTLAK